MPDREYGASPIEDRLASIERSVAEISRAVQGAQDEGNVGLLIRTVRLEQKVAEREIAEEKYRRQKDEEIGELRAEWRSFRRVVMVWAIAALFAGAAAGTGLAELWTAIPVP